MGKDLLTIKNLNKNYQTIDREIKAVDNFDLSIKPNEFIAIVGPSGCGKSTILSILSGLDKNYGGKIVKDKDVKIGYMLQQDALFEWLTILDNCLIGLEIQGKKNNKNINYVKSLLYNYGLKDFINSHPSNLSGGMRQRVALIRTLATKPDILLMDEPFSALDYQARLAISDDVYRIIKKEHKSAIIVTHDIAEAISMADKVIILSDRPCHIKKIVDIKLTDKSNPINNRKTKEFKDYYDEIWKEIDYHV